jgi:hypothetical protein
MQRSEGVHVVALWNEQALIKQPDGAPAPRAFAADLAWPQTLNVTVYDPVSGTVPVDTKEATQSLQIAISDHPLLIFLSTPSGK